MSPKEASIDLAGLNRALLARQLLLERADLPVVRAIARIGGLQAQWPRPPHLGMATRLVKFASADLVSAARKGSIVRGTFHRGTLHLVSAESYRQQRRALQPVLDKALTSVLKSRPAFDVEAVVATARAALEKSPSTFGVLRDRLARAHPGVDERAMGYAVRLKLPLLMVPTDSPYGWPADAQFTLAEALAGGLCGEAEGRKAFVLEYLGAFGPATAQDAEAASGLLALTPELVALETSGEIERLRGPGAKSAPLFDRVDAPRPAPETTAPPRLLPEYDSTLLAHRDRTRIVPPEHRSRVILPGLRVPATFLLDGFVAGSWAVEGKGAKTKITFAPFGAPLKKRELAALEEEGARLLSMVTGTSSTSSASA